MGRDRGRGRGADGVRVRVLREAPAVTRGMSRSAGGAVNICSTFGMFQFFRDRVARIVRIRAVARSRRPSDQSTYICFFVTSRMSLLYSAFRVNGFPCAPVQSLVPKKLSFGYAPFSCFCA